MKLIKLSDRNLHWNIRYLRDVLALNSPGLFWTQAEIDADNADIRRSILRMRRELERRAAERMCVNCAFWEPVTPEPAEYGVCNHPALPWDTQERRDIQGDYAACMGCEETCKRFAKAPSAA